jgi:Cytosolic domain of 10TM putative phosphate transporter
LIFLILCYFLLAVFKNRLVNEHKIIDIETDTASDFSVMVTYLPKSAQESDIKEFFETEFEGVSVKEISMAYDIGALNKMEKEKDVLHDKLVNKVASSITRITTCLIVQTWMTKKKKMSRRPLRIIRSRHRWKTTRN